jgi:hypothetical protein
MRILELFETTALTAEKQLMSLLVHQIARINQTGGPAEIRMSALIQKARSAGIHLNSSDDIETIINQNPNFKNLISDFNADTIILNIPGDDPATISSKADLDVEPVDAVDRMAKRALKKRT